MAKTGTKAYVAASTAYRGPDHCTSNGARTLAKRVRAYWATLGYRVETTITPIGGTEKKLRGFCGVRSDMVDGWPRAHAA